MSVKDITPEMLTEAFIGMGTGRPTARGRLLRLLDGDIDKVNALAIEFGLQHFSDYAHSGKAPAGTPLALKTDTKLRDNDPDAPKGSNPWTSDCVDHLGRPAWSVEQRKLQTQKVKEMGYEFATRLAKSAGSFVGASKPGAVDLTPRNDQKDTRTSAMVMEDRGRG